MDSSKIGREIIQTIVLKCFYQNCTFLLTLRLRNTTFGVLKHHATYDVITSKWLNFVHLFITSFDRAMNCASFAPFFS